MTGSIPAPSADGGPSRRGYVLAGVVALAGLLAGGAVFFVGLFSYATSVPGFTQRLASREPAQVTLEENRVMVVYVATGDDVDATCTSDSDAVAVTRVPYRTTTTKDGRTWSTVYDLDASESGTYSLACTAARDVGFAIGPPAENGPFLASIAGMFGLTFLGAVAGGVLALVTARRRKRYREQ